MTVYHEVVPSNYLNPILWAEAERMSSLAVNEKNFNSERDVVKEEYRQRILANPFGEFFLDSIRIRSRSIPTNGRESGTSRTWTLRSSRKCAPFIQPFTGRTMRLSWWWAIFSLTKCAAG